MLTDKRNRFQRPTRIMFELVVYFTMYLTIKMFAYYLLQNITLVTKMCSIIYAGTLVLTVTVYLVTGISEIYTVLVANTIAYHVLDFTIIYTRRTHSHISAAQACIECIHHLLLLSALGYFYAVPKFVALGLVTETSTVLLEPLRLRMGVVMVISYYTRILLPLYMLHLSIFIDPCGSCVLFAKALLIMNLYKFVGVLIDKAE